MEDRSDFPAVMVLFGLLYVLNIEYPKGQKYTIKAVQTLDVKGLNKTVRGSTYLKKKKNYKTLFIYLMKTL